MCPALNTGGITDAANRAVRRGMCCRRVSAWLSELFHHRDKAFVSQGHPHLRLRQRNVLRTFGKGAAALTIVGDIGKGILAVLLAKWAFGAFTAADPIYGAYIAAFCAVLGHVYPVYFGFKGGKAVSVATGTIIAIKPVLILPLLAVFFIVFLCSKMVSLASICCAAAYPAAQQMLATCCAAVIGGLVIWLHRSNIQRIKNGTEYKFGRKKK